MDVLAELEIMASSAAAFASVDTDADLERWHTLFGYTSAEAVAAINHLRNGMDSMVSFEHWESVRHKQEALGHNLLTYTHFLTRNYKQPKEAVRTRQLPSTDTKEYFVQLGGPIATPEALAQLLGMQKPPATIAGHSEESGNTTQFCCINGAARATLLARLAETTIFSPLIISPFYAKKDFCSISIAPTLGVDSTLPQNRCEGVPQPTQAQYPVWYFFYGTLASSAKLKELFAHVDPEGTTYELVSAQVKGGKIGQCGSGRYRALIDGPMEAAVDGHAFLVPSKEHEDALRYYETALYEVVRCKIDVLDHVTRPGCTFRFVGILD